MRDRLIIVLQRGRTAFSDFTAGQKVMVAVAIVALAVGGYFFATWAGKPSYSPLFTNLAAADASAIVDKLTADGVSYQLSDGGSTILVPQDKVYAERIKLSGAGLPAQSDAGYALLDKQGTLTSDFTEQVTYQRALEGELAKTIKSINGVTTATVHLAIPKKDVFSDNKQKPTASVLVATSAGKKLTAEQVQAVVHLVASSVPDLAPEQVTVVGGDGKVLSTGGEDSAAAGDLRSQQTAAYENRLSGDLQHLLDQAVGPGHSAVQVTAELDFDTTQTTTQKYVADPSAPPLSQSTKNETYAGNGTAVGGVLGPDNIQVPTGTSGGTGQYSQTEDTRNNAVGSITESRKSAPGSVRKQSVAVLLDSAVAQDADVTRLQQLVTSAAGVDTTRGDTLAVSAMKFDTATTKQTQKELQAADDANQQAQLRSWIETGVVVAAVLILLLLAWLSNRKRRKKVKLTPEENQQLEELQAALEEARGQAALPGSDAAELEAGDEPGGPAALDQRKKDLVVLIERQPDEVAHLLRGWLADRRS